MDPLQRSYSRRSLLPVEQQIIDALGLTLEEYWHFCRLADCKAKERGPEYDLIPEVNASGLEPWVVSLLIGVASTAASVLLAPKPPGPGPEAIRTADVRGQTKFAELFGFDSLQDLATLGSIIPLVFTKQITNPGDSRRVFGGVRVKGMLLWSQLLSKGSHQELKMLTTLGLSSLTSPDPEGLAIGDQLLRSYQDSRYKAYFKNNPEDYDDLNKGGRITESNAIANAGSLPPLEHDDVFEAYDRTADTFRGLFCGARTPNSQTSFGCHNPIPNGALYHIPYDIVQIMKGSKGKLFEKRQKINTPYSGRMAMNELHRAGGGSSIFASDPDSAVPVIVEKDDELVFTIAGDREDPEGFAPHGLVDVNSAIDQRAIDADAKIALGDLFLFGSALLKCQHIRSDLPWEISGDTRPIKQFEFKCLERGAATLANANAAISGSIPYYGNHLQEVAIGTVTNNRKCHQTEIGIKSTVFKRIDNFANVQSEPEAAQLFVYEQDKQPFSLGRISAYQTRYSFFRLELRRVIAGNEDEFANLMPNEIFAVKGSNPQAQYNTIRINHPFAEYEFRLMPVPGAVFGNLYEYEIEVINLLEGKGRTTVAEQGEFIISYTGRRAQLTRENTSNDQFEFQSIENQTILVTGIVDEFTKNGTDALIGEDPIDANYKLLETRVDFDDDAVFLNDGVLVNVANPNDPGAIYAAWAGSKVELEREIEGFVYRKGSTKIRTIPASQKTWQATEEKPFIFSGTPLSNHNYVKFGSTSQATQLIIGGNEVSLSLFEQPGQENLNALYRRGSQSTRLEVQNDPTRVVADAPNNNGELYQANVFFVIVFDTGSVTGRWAGVNVTVGATASEANPIQYRQGASRVYRDEVQKFDVFPIYRVQYQAPTLTDFSSVEVGSYISGPNEIARDLFEIEQYQPINQREFVPGGEPAEYSLSGGSGTGLKINASSFGTGKWQWLVSNGGSGYQQGDVLTHTFGDGTEVSIQVKAVRDQFAEVPGREHLNPLDAIADFPKYELERTSHQDGPEHQVVFVNELIRPGEDLDNVSIKAQYDDLSLLGLRVLAGRDWTSMGQLTAYIKQGIKVERLINDDGTTASLSAAPAATNNFAEIAYNLLVNKRIGAGQKIPAETVDRDAMVIAAKFCHANGFTYDGVIEDKVALREFIHQNAAFNLLDFKVIGGKFSLSPSVPYNSSNFRIAHKQDINTQVKALFTDGNIKDMQVNFLTPQERQLAQIVVSYREEVPNGFSEQKTLRLRFKNSFGGSETDPEDAIDLTQFCTNRAHAETIAQYSLTTRKHVDHTIRFKTTPSSAMALEAGDYIKVVSNSTHTSRLHNGSVDSEGNITATSELNDSDGYDIFYWKPGSGEQAVIEGQMPVAGMKTGDETFFNSIFTLKMKNELKRVYRIDSLTVDDEGYVDVTGTHQPLTSTGALATINLDPGQFLPDADDRD